MSQQFTSSVLQEMMNEDYNKLFHRYETVYDKNMHGSSPSDIGQQLTDDLYARMAGPLKNMQAAYLRDISTNCYKERHMSESFTNYEQIMLCKE